MEKVAIDGSGTTERYVMAYDENGNPFSISYYSSLNDITPDTYYYVLNLQGDVLQLRDSNNNVVCIYTYDAWGKVLSVTNASGTAITDSKHIANVNPFRYRGYYYDVEIGFYYCNSRYYDPEVGRFINADVYTSTEQGFGGYNMFAYCQNNPVTFVDPDGMSIKNVLSDTWKGIRTFVKKTFGAGSSTTQKSRENVVEIFKDPSPITLKVGENTTEVISQHGDSSKPISVYAIKDANHPVKSSTVGLKLNIRDFSVDLSLGLDNIGLNGSLSNGNKTGSLAYRINLSELKIGYEMAESIELEDDLTENYYINAGVSGGFIFIAYAFLTTGQYVPLPQYAY